MNKQIALGSPNAKWKSPYTQQGDVLLKKCGKFGIFNVEHESIPKDAIKIAGNLILKGQTNSHALYNGEFQLYKSGETLFVRVDKATILDHVKDHTKKKMEKAEHHAQWIPSGEYFVDGVMEFDHLKEEARQVID